MIILLFKLIIITSILSLAWRIVSNDDMILFSVREWLTNKVEKGNRWFEPLICIWCSASYFAVAGLLFGYAFRLFVFSWEIIC